MLVFLCFSGVAMACSVPVFRYALENWPVDPYEVILFHPGDRPLDPGIQDVFKETDVEEFPLANARCTEANISESMPESVQSLWKQEGKPREPWLAVTFPVESGLEDGVWSGPGTVENAKKILDSPARQEIAKRLVAGETAVWVFLESGNAKADAVLLRRLEILLARLENELELPDPGPLPPWVNPEDLPELKVDFSLVRVSRQDPAESFLVQTLLKSEPGLAEIQEAMVFPVFGKGRALYALVDKGIDDVNVEEACSFLVGPCSCVVKSMHPGVDLLISCSWDVTPMADF